MDAESALSVSEEKDERSHTESIFYITRIISSAIEKYILGCGGRRGGIVIYLE